MLALVFGLIDPLHASGPAPSVVDDQPTTQEGRSGSTWRSFVVVSQGCPHSAMAGDGRFLSRDPDDGDLETPESLAPYLFAAANPMVFSDPTGYFTIAEISIGMNMQQTLNSASTMSRQAAVQYARNQISQISQDIIWRSVIGMVPGADFLSRLDGVSDAMEAGRTADKMMKRLLAGAMRAAGAGDMLWIEPALLPIRGSKDRWYAKDNGIQGTDYPEKGRGPTPRGSRNPDFMISATPPNQGGKGYLIGDIKYSASMFTGRYITSNRSSQFAAIVGYARHNQYFPVAVFACAYSGGREIQSKWKEKVHQSGLANGVYLLLLSGDSVRGRK